MSNFFVTMDNIANAYCSVRKKCPRLHFTTGRKLRAVLKMLYMKCHILVTFLGIYCKNMNYDASL